MHEEEEEANLHDYEFTDDPFAMMKTNMPKDELW
jgi:hypothetical protein